MADPKLIVLTPVKNEDWILGQFLEITSLFADDIIVADQNSTDASRDICHKFPKVHLINNNSIEFNEAERQSLLIETARELFPHNKRILLALDADEIFSASSLYQTDAWEKIKSLEEGTTLYFEKPDVLPGTTECVRYRDNYFALGYIDDRVKHSPVPIHSKRIPGNSKQRAVWINNIKILHFAHARKNVQSSKLRYYSALENIKKINPVYLRRRLYSCFYNESKFYHNRKFEEIPAEWIDHWNDAGINIRNFSDPLFSWYDFEVLSFFRQFGSKKFHLDDIWHFDWESCRQEAMKANKDFSTLNIEYPGFLKKTAVRLIDKSYALYRHLKN